MRYNEIKPLMEINMSPSSLKHAVSTIPAIVGIEFEMYVPNVPAPELEADFDIGDRIYDFTYDQFKNFFAPNFLDEVDFNNPETISDVWVKIMEDYDNYAIPRIKESDDFKLKLNSAIKHFLGQKSKTKSDKEFKKEVNNFIKEKDNDYHMLYEDLISDFLNSADITDDYLSYKGWEGFRNIWEEYKDELMWPYTTNNLDKINNLAYDFEDHIQSPYSVMVLETDPSYKRWAIVLDGSLIPNDDGEGGWEFVSPKLPLSELGTTLDNMKSFMNEKDCYTNKSTGLHINVSIENSDMRNLDYIKLVLLLGDNYVANQFGRYLNHYANSSFDLVNNTLEQNIKQIDQMKIDLASFSKKLINSTNKMTSVNLHKNRIEFRSPGGDYLSILKNDPDKITNTIYRMAVALDAALDKNKYKNEYIKKFYKLISKNIKTDATIEPFIKYCAGEIDKNDLKTMLSFRQNVRKQNANPNKSKYKVFRLNDSDYICSPSIEIVNKYIYSPQTIEVVPHLDGKLKLCNSDMIYKDVFIVFKFFDRHDEIPSKYINNPKFIILK